MEPKRVMYCGICTMPLEYCEFSGTQEKCKEWLKDSYPSIYDQLYSGEGGSFVEGRHFDVPVERTIVKDKSAKLEAKLEKQIQKKKSSRITIKRVERTKRKCITIVHGLEVFEVDLKKAAKLFANRFACGSSVAKNNMSQDEIVVQGDFSEELEEMIKTNWPQVPAENIDIVEEKKKKNATTTTTT